VAEQHADRLRREAGMPPSARSRHLVFTGNPGTAKTTVARILARLYAKLGTLSNGHLVETSRGGLVAGYIGQTAPKTRKRFVQAVGGCCSSTRRTPSAHRTRTATSGRRRSPRC
jgi:SpoVK/Ycf46/Vps4 family AAA+-type ATPase